MSLNFFRSACNEAWKYQGLTYPNPAVGAVVAKGDTIISCEAHKRAGEPHAEVEALKSAFLKLSTDSNKKELLSKLHSSKEIHEFLIQNARDTFKECNLYVTLEPCSHEGKTPSCALLLTKLKPNAVFFGTKEQNSNATGGYEILSKAGINTIFVDDKECFELTEPFFIWNSSKSFIFFKLALTMNGQISGGKISCEESFFLTHALRDRVELLCIGGNTVRIDRPTLDARAINGRAPNVLIYSSQNNFDMTIPLFSVPNREVFIENSLDRAKNSRFVMIEGGRGMLEASKELASHYLFYISPKLTQKSDLDALSLSFKILHSRMIDNNLLVWAKKE